MKRLLSESVIRYKLYEAALETGITTTQYQSLMSEGVLDWMKDALASISAGKEMAGDLKKMFSDKKNQAIYQKATQEIQKSVAELFKAGAEAGVDKDQLKDWLIAGINKMTETAADSAPAADEKAKEAGEVKPGEPVDPGKPESAVPALAAAAADAAGQDPEKAKENATEKNMDVPKVTKFLANAVAKQANADPGLVEKVIGWLLQNKHLAAENGGRVTAAHLLRAAKSALRFSTSRNDSLVMERWSRLAGILKEEGDKKAEEAKKQFGDLLVDLQKALSIEDKDAEPLANILIALDELESLQIEK